MEVTAARLKVVVDPSFRTMDEIFSPTSLARLQECDIIWGRNEPMPTDILLDHRDDADVYVFGEWRHGPGTLEAMGPQFRALLEVAGGHEHAELGYGAALERRLLIGSCAAAFAPEVAEHGLALALSLLRGVAFADRSMRERTEVWLHDGNSANRTLLGSTVGFLGCGGISRQLQRLLVPFDVDLLGYDPPLPSEEFDARGITPVSLSEMFDRADLIFVLAAPTPATIGIVSRPLIERLGDHQSLVVLSRGSLVDFESLAECSARQGFGFATDVFPREPIAADDPVRAIRRSVLTPHLAGALPSALHRIGDMVIDDLAAIRLGTPPQSMSYLTLRNSDRFVQD